MDLPIVGDVRGQGLITAVDLVADKTSKAGFQVTAQAGARMSKKCIENGVIVRPVRDRLVLSPPITINREECDFLLSALRSAISDIA